MAQLFNYDKKQWEDHPDDDALNAKVASGAYGLEAGLKIPVINPETGNIFELPTEHASEAFKTGIRLATPTELKAHTEVRQQQVKDEALNAPLEAGLLGAARGATFGLSDVAARVLGGEKTGKLLKDVREANPTSSLIGEVGGALAAPVPGAAAVKGAEQGAKLGLEAALGTSKAAQIVSRVAPKAVGSAAEGMMYGLGSGISEAALGDPQDVVEHLAHGAATGAVFGGLLGAGVAGAKETVPLFKEIGKWAYKGAEAAAPEATKIAADITGKITGIPSAMKQRYVDFVANRTAEKHGVEAGQAVRDLMADTVKTNEAIVNGARVREINKELNQMEAQGAKELAANEASIQAEVGRSPKQMAREAASNEKQISNDLLNTAQDLNTRHQDAANTFYSQLDQHYADVPGQQLAKLQSDLQPMLNRLDRSSEPRAQSMADSIRARLQSVPDQSIAEEIKTIDGLRNELFVQQPKVYSTADRKVIDDMHSMAKSVLESYPVKEIADGISSLNKVAAEKEQLSRIIGAKTDSGVTSNLASLLANPEKQAVFSTLAENIGDIAPQLKSIQARMAKASTRRDAINEFVNLIDSKKSATVGNKLSMNDAIDVLNMFGRIKGDTEKFVDRARELQGALKSADLGPADKFLALKKVFGQSVGKELQKDLSKVANLKSTVDKLDSLAGLPNIEQQQNVPTALAAWIAGPKVAAAVHGATTIRNIGANPLRTVKNLVMVERAANAGARKIQDALSAVGSAIGSNSARRATVSYKTYGESLKDTRANFAKQKEILTQTRDPDAMASYLADRIPAMHGTPMVQSALMSHAMNTANFLASKLPTDPFAGQTILGSTPNFIPSDSELSKFNRYVNAAQHPDMAIESVARLSASPEEVETLKVLYPRTFQRLQNEVVNAITKPGVTLSYPQRLMASQILDAPADASMRPEFIQAMQARYAQQMPNNQGGRPPEPAPTKPINIDLKPLETVQTSAQKVYNK